MNEKLHSSLSQLSTHALIQQVFECLLCSQKLGMYREGNKVPVLMDGTFQ